jgi:HAD superfamily hydrolase (TIGR01509 family)
MLGKRNDQIVREFFKDQELTDEQVFDHGAAKEALYRELMGPVLQEHILPGVPQFLDVIREAPIGLATNAEPANVEFVLTGAGLESYFRVRVDGHQVERPKPHPDIYLLAAKRLGADPENCVVFEDSLTGVEAAKRAGMRVVGVRSTLSELPGADLLVEDFRDPELKLWMRSALSYA